jgi:ABC-type Fe3+ transport system substrate-binding protein
MMKRYRFLILFVIVLVTPFVLRTATGTRSASPGGDALRLVIVTPHVEGIRREFADGFSHWHEQTYGPAVVIDYRMYGGASEIVRYLRAEEPRFQQLGTYNIDLVWGGGDFLFEEQLERGGYLQPVRLSANVMRRAFPARTFNGINLYDESDPPHWFGAALSAFGIIYNKDVLAHLGAPEPGRWDDLADPKLAGWFVAADPTRSASARQVFMLIVERAMLDAQQTGRSQDEGWTRGMGLVRLICSNARYFTDASSSVPNVVSSGDAAAGMAIDFYGRAQVNAVGEHRLGYVEPNMATALNADPIAVLKGAPNRELAVRFIEFVLSEPGQRLWNTRAGALGGPRTTSLRRLPIMPSVYESPRDFTDRVNPFDASFAFASSNERKRTFPILGELIEVSCINLLEELRDTRAAILASSRRAELEARLGAFPFDQQEALARQAKFLDRKTTALEKVELKRRWQEEFRREYAGLRAEALR